MLKKLSQIFANVSDFLIPTLVGALFFFAIIGVFGLWFAIGGLLLAIIAAVTIVRRVPAEGDAR